MKPPRLLLVIALALLGASGAAAWDHDGHGNPHGKGRDFDERADRARHRRYGDSCFREEHLRLIHDYYQPRDLPPGLQKKYDRTGQLPPGWQKRIRPFPVAIERQLPPLCEGCARGYVDGFAVVYRPRTGLILDFHAVLAP